MKLFDVIINDDTNRSIVYKSPVENFYNNTQLIVSESERALFFNDGVVIKVFDEGKYTLNTSNLPILSSIQKAFTGGKAPYQCKILFVSLTHQLETMWGTDSPVQMRDSKFKIMISVRAHGTYSVKVVDPKKFVQKMLGMNITSFTQKDLAASFKSAFTMHIKENLHHALNAEGMTILDINGKLSEISSQLKSHIAPLFESYGLEAVNLYIEDISISESDPNYKIINEALAKKAVLDIQGADYERLIRGEAIINASRNPGNPGALAGIAVGMMAGGAILGNQNGGGGGTPPKGGFCSNCGAQLLQGAKFCSNCGTPVPSSGHCPNCGKAVTPEQAYCDGCGAKLK